MRILCLLAGPIFFCSVNGEGVEIRNPVGIISLDHWIDGARADCYKIFFAEFSASIVAFLGCL